MAHAIQPYAEPRQQLRTEAPRQRPHDDKYVSVFESGSASADLTFRDPILSESADHFSVGIDELTISLGSLSMLEYNATYPSVLMRVHLRGVDGAANNAANFNDWLMPDGPAGNLGKWRESFEFKVDRAYTNINEVLKRLNEIANAVEGYFHTEGIVNPGAGNIFDPTYAPFPVGQGINQAPGGNSRHLQVVLTPNGSIQFYGSRTFWANFVIQVPELKYREIFFGNTTKEHVSLHPITGAINNAPYTPTIVGGAITLYTVAAFAPAIAGADIATIVAVPQEIEHSYAGNQNLLNTLDRRVTIEVSCSLPIKNSPMVDHGKEAPDFALARFMYHRASTLGTGDTADVLRIDTHGIGTKMLQGPRDRVIYHHLRPQQKIQTLRMRIWARVRTYDTTTRKWGMKTIICPMSSLDFWHARLHFLHKDK